MPTICELMRSHILLVRQMLISCTGSVPAVVLCFLDQYSRSHSRFVLRFRSVGPVNPSLCPCAHGL